MARDREINFWRQAGELEDAYLVAKANRHEDRAAYEAACEALFEFRSSMRALAVAGLGDIAPGTVLAGVAQAAATGNEIGG